MLASAETIALDGPDWTSTLDKNFVKDVASLFVHYDSILSNHVKHDQGKQTSNSQKTVV